MYEVPFVCVKIPMGAPLSSNFPISTDNNCRTPLRRNPVFWQHQPQRTKCDNGSLLSICSRSWPLGIVFTYFPPPFLFGSAACGQYGIQSLSLQLHASIATFLSSSTLSGWL